MQDPSFPDLARIDGQKINLATLDDAVTAAIARASDRRGFRLFTLNLDHLVKRRDDTAFRVAYAAADFVSADGAPVAWLARRQSARIARTTGADLVLPLCRAAARKGIAIALFGSDAATLEKTRTELISRLPALVVAHIEAPPYGFEPGSEAAKEAGQRLAASGARLVFVALGAPKQEIFAAAMALHAPDLGFVCIGAALDFIAGTQVRAPAVFQKTGLEWLWRLGTNPRRFIRRYLLCARLLVSLVVADKRRPADIPT